MISSLERIRAVLGARAGDAAPMVLPGHGPLVTEPGPLLGLALEARAARLAQAEDAVRDGCLTTGAIADRLYGPFDERIRRGIEATVRAHLRYLHDRGRLSHPVKIDG